MATVAELKAAQDVAGLIAALKDSDWDVRQRAAEALGELKAEKAIEALLAARQDENGNVRWSAVWALGEIGGEPVQQALIASLENEPEDVRSAALRILSKSEDPRALEAVQRAIPVQQKPRMSLPQLLRYLTFAVGGVGVLFLALAIYFKLRQDAIIIVVLALVAAAIVLWQVGGRKG